jgi:hypothetical protein
LFREPRLLMRCSRIRSKATFTARAVGAASPPPQKRKGDSEGTPLELPVSFCTSSQVRSMRPRAKLYAFRTETDPVEERRCYKPATFVVRAAGAASPPAPKEKRSSEGTPFELPVSVCTSSQVRLMQGRLETPCERHLIGLDHTLRQPVRVLGHGSINHPAPKADATPMAELPLPSGEGGAWVLLGARLR